MGQETPALGPAPGFLRHVPLGQLPSLPLLRRAPGAPCVRRRPRYSEAGRLPAPVHHGRAPGVPRAALALARQARGRASRVPHSVFRRLPEVFDPAGSVAAWPERRRPWCLPRVRSALAPETSADCGAPYSAGVFPCHRCADTVTGACAGLGASVVGWTFTVGDLPPSPLCRLVLALTRTLRLSRAWKRERSGRWKASAAGG